MKKEQTRIGELLLDASLISDEQLEKALAEQGRTGWKLGSILVSMGFIDENLLATFLSMQTGVPCVSLQNVFPSPAVLELLPKTTARRAGAIPIKRVDDTLHVAMVDPTDSRTLEELKKATRLEILPLIAPATAVSRALQTYYPRRGRTRPRPQPGSIAPDVTAEIEQELHSMARAIGNLARSVQRLRKRIGRP